MQASEFSPILVCRPAYPQDTADVLELTRTIWEGHDYVPSVWQDWLEDPDGLLVVAQLGKHVVGLCRLSRQTEDQWWLSGLRVHPEYERRGIATHLNDYILDYWLRKGNGTIRLATGAQRVAVHRLCEHKGFQKIGEYSLFAAPALAEPVTSFHPLHLGEAEQALDFALESPGLALVNGMFDLGWEWCAPAVRHIEAAIHEGKAFWWRSQEGLLLYWEDEEEGQKYPSIMTLLSSLELLPDLLLDYRRLAAVLGYTQAFWFASLHPELGQMLVLTGFKLAWEAVVWLFEKRHPGESAQPSGH